MKFLLPILMLFGILLNGAEYKTIADFENAEDIRLWNRETDPHMAFDGSSDWSESGKASAKVSFSPGGETWKVNRLQLKDCNANNWSAHDTYELTIYNPGPATYSKGALIWVYSGYGRLRVSQIKPGVNHYIFEIDEIRNSADLKNIPEIWIGWKSPSEKIHFYVDNIRLGDYTAERREALEERLKTASNTLYSKRTEFLALRHRVPQAGREELKDIHRQAGTLAVEILNRATAPLSINQQKALTAILAPLPMQDIRNSEGSPEARKIALNNIAEGERRAAQLIRQRDMKRALQKQIVLHYPNEAFAVGRCPYPRAWRKEDIFEGPLNGGVELTSAAREIASCQLLILGQRDCSNIQVSVELNTLPEAGIEIAPMGWVKNPRDGKLIADMLRPDIKTFNVAANDIQPVWINIEIPAGTQSGNYSGTIKISGDGQTDSITLNLRVYPFELPAVPTLHTATSGAVYNPSVDYDFLRKYRFRPGNIYTATAPSISEMKNSGVTFFNLMRFSDQGKGGFVKKDGKTIYSPARWRLYAGKVNKWIQENVKTESDWEYILKNCFIYTYDEPTPEAAASLSGLCGKIKKQYRGIRTAAAFNMDVDPRIDNLDIIMGTPQYLKNYRMYFPELKQSGKEIWWYNLFNDSTNPVGCRGQFWATWLDGLDGVLHYLVRDRTNTLFGYDLYYPQDQGKNLRPGENGTIRRNTRKEPLPTVAFEYWREGLQDYEYLNLLRCKTEELAASPKANKHAGLLNTARQLLKLDGIATGILDDSPKQENEITLAFSRLSSNMSDFTKTKKQAAELIIKIQQALSE